MTWRWFLLASSLERSRRPADFAGRGRLSRDDRVEGRRSRLVADQQSGEEVTGGARGHRALRNGVGFSPKVAGARLVTCVTSGPASVGAIASIAQAPTMNATVLSKSSSSQ